MQQSVTYSPVSHCVTRDSANIFEKKKQRMEKIQKLRGLSNQSEQIVLSASAQILDGSLLEKADELVNVQIVNHKTLEVPGSASSQTDVFKKKLLQRNSIAIDRICIESEVRKPTAKKKHPISQPLTPRKFNIENILQKLG